MPQGAGDVARIDGSSQPKGYRKNDRLGPLSDATGSGVIVAMTTTNDLLSSYWFGSRAGRFVVGVERSGTESASRGLNKQRDAQRAQAPGVTGAGTGAPHAATVGVA